MANPAAISNLFIRRLLLASGNDGIELDCNSGNATPLVGR
jgi:hypothetical protein